MRCCADNRIVVVITLLIVFCTLATASRAGVPISLYASHSGRMDFVGTGGTLRDEPNSGNACSVNNLGTGQLSGLPAGATVVAAYLYWAGSYSRRGGSTQRDPDYDITFEGQFLSAERTFTERFRYGGTRYDFFSGFRDVTAIVAARGNGWYTFEDLQVNTANPHCAVQAVVAGWALVVVFEHASQPHRVVNIYDGFEYFRGGQSTVTPNNFRVAAGSVDGKASHITWEGDSENSAALNGFTENLVFNGTNLTDGFNPINNQFNSTINITGDATTWGVDFDVYDVSALLSPGDTQATSIYRSGRDLVLLNAEVISVTNTATADLELTITHSDPFSLYENSDITLTVANNGPNDTDDDIVVTATLPTGLGYVSDGGAGWVVDSSGDPVLTCTYTGVVLSGQQAPGLILTVVPSFAALGSVTFNAQVACTTFDNIPLNNIASEVINVVAAAAELTAQKSVATVSDPVNGVINPKAIPGATILYTIETSNQRAGSVDGNTVTVIDQIPVNTVLFVGDLTGPGSGPIEFNEGTQPSGLTYTFANLNSNGDDVSFSDDGAVSFSYTPVPDALGYDPLVTHVRVTPGGVFAGRVPAGPTSFRLSFMVQLQ